MTSRRDFCGAARGARHRLRLGDARHALFGFAFAGQDRIEENLSDAADRDGRQKEDGDRLHGVPAQARMASLAASAASSAAARRFSSP